MADTVRDVIIIGGGLGAWSAAIYLGRNQRDSVLIELGTLDGGMATGCPKLSRISESHLRQEGTSAQALMQMLHDEVKNHVPHLRQAMREAE